MAFGDGPANEGGMNAAGATNSGYDPTVDPSAESESATSVDHPLNERQTAMYEATEAVVEQYGQFDQDTGGNGAHYVAESPFAGEGLVCANCAFYDGARACEVVRGDIGPAGVCKLWIIPADLIVRSTMPHASTRSDASYIVRTWESPDAAELRSSSDGRDIMTGHFAVFNKWTEINSRHEGQFMERIDPKAFNDTLAKRAKSIRVLYDHGRDRALAILRAVHAALPEGGTLLVAEPMAGAEGAETVGAVYFPFYLLAMRGGDARSADAICALVREAGFVDVAVRKTRSPLFTGLITARR